MTKLNQTTDNNNCIACRAAIQPDALICPHCHSPQKHRQIESFFVVMKLIGSVTVIISLIIGVEQLGDIAGEWKKRDETVSLFIKASTMLVDMRDYKSAWKIINQATSIAPNSKEALNKQVDVAVAWTRDLWNQKKDETYSAIIDPLIMTLFLGANDRNPARSAEIFAHIGWANIIRLRDKKASYEVDKYLLKALELDPVNTYANLYRGYWLLSNNNSNRKDDSVLSEALSHFLEALKSNNDTQYVKKWCIIALSESEIEGSIVELFIFVNEWRKQGNAPIESTIGYNFLRSIRYLDHELSEGSFLVEITKELSRQEIRDTYLWLFEGRLNEFYRPDHADMWTSFNLGLLAEVTGDVATAYNIYLDTMNKSLGTSSGARINGRVALSRIINKTIKDEKKIRRIPVPN